MGRVRIEPNREPPDDWTVSHAPAANTRATMTRPAALNLQNICTSLVVMLVGGAVPITHPLCDTLFCGP